MNLKKTTQKSGVRLFYTLLFSAFLLVSLSACKKDDIQDTDSDSIVPKSTTTTPASNTPASNTPASTTPASTTPAKATPPSGVNVTNPLNPVASTYKHSNPISLTGASNITISGDSINCLNANTPGISLVNCNNIHITKSKIYNSKGDGIYLLGCTNVTVDTCYITNIATGVNAVKCTGVIVNYNQMKNVIGPYPSGQFVMLNQVNGAGDMVTNNKLEDISGQSDPEDAINIYESNGTAASPIIISGNWIRGGGPSTSGGGILLGDVGGSYQIAENNVLVNPGMYGMGVVAGTNMQILNNQIYSSKTTVSGVGIDVSNQYTSTTGCSMITVDGNQVNWTNSAGMLDNNWDPGQCGTITGWNDNTWGANISSSILPATIITYQ